MRDVSPLARSVVCEEVGDVILMTAVAGNLNYPGHYFKLGFIQVSMGNLVVILVMVVLFVLALLLPFPKGRDGS